MANLIKTPEPMALATFRADTPFDPQALMRSAEAFDAGSRNDYLSFRDGIWMYGADRVEICEKSLWAVNPYSFKFGLMEWYNGEAGAELMVPAGVPYTVEDLKMQFPNPDDSSQHRVSPQIAVDIKCVSGEETNLQLTYKTSTKGGVDALNNLAQSIAGQGVADASLIVAVVNLTASHYMHRKHKRRTYVPVFKINNFTTLNQ